MVARTVQVGWLLLLLAFPLACQSSRSSADRKSDKETTPTFGYFEPNLGQFRDDVMYAFRGADAYDAFFFADRLEIVSRNGDVQTIRHPRLTLTEQGLLSGQSNYYRGGRGHWVQQVPHFGRLRGRFRGYETRIDFRSSAGRLEYDIIAAEDLDHLRFSTNSTASLNSQAFSTRGANGVFRHRIAQTLVDGSPGISSFVRDSDGLGFQLAEDQSRHTIIIDPVIEYTSYLGGDANDHAEDITWASGDVFCVTGWGRSSDYPTVNAYQDQFAGGESDAYVTCMDQGTVHFSTYLGGVDNLGIETDGGRGIAWNGSEVVVVGSAEAADFPVTQDAKWPNYGGQNDAFIARLDLAGTLVYSTFFGGSGEDYAHAVDIGPNGAIYITGNTTSDDLPTSQSAFQPDRSGGADAFALLLDSTGTVVRGLTYLGGTANEDAFGISALPNGSAAIVGRTLSTDFPLEGNPLDVSNEDANDGFLAVVRSDAASLDYASYLGGAAADSATAVTTDDSGSIFVAGYTESSDYPTTAGVVQSTHGGLRDIFVTKLAPDMSLEYSTFLGGGGYDSIGSLGPGRIETRDGLLAIAATSTSDDLPITVFSTPAGGEDCYLALLGPGGDFLQFARYVGGTGDDSCDAVSLNATRRVAFLGSTTSSDLPVTGNAYQSMLNTPRDSMLTVMESIPAPLTLELDATSSTLGPGEEQDLTATLNNAYYTSVLCAFSSSDSTIISVEQLDVNIAEGQNSATTRLAAISPGTATIEAHLPAEVGGAQAIIEVSVVSTPNPDSGKSGCSCRIGNEPFSRSSLVFLAGLLLSYPVARRRLRSKEPPARHETT